MYGTGWTGILGSENRFGKKKSSVDTSNCSKKNFFTATQYGKSSNSHQPRSWSTNPITVSTLLSQYPMVLDSPTYQIRCKINPAFVILQLIELPRLESLSRFSESIISYFIVYLRRCFLCCSPIFDCPIYDYDLNLIKGVHVISSCGKSRYIRHALLPITQLHRQTQSA